MPSQPQYSGTKIHFTNPRTQLAVYLRQAVKIDASDAENPLRRWTTEQQERARVIAQALILGIGSIPALMQGDPAFSDEEVEMYLEALKASPYFSTEE